MKTADCLNTQSRDGRNLTPVAILKAMHRVFGGGPELDPASDAVANRFVKADKIYSKEDDGFSREWSAKTAWLNPPGRTTSQGKQISGSEWSRKLHRHWSQGDIDHAILLCYRGGSLGSLGYQLLHDSVICLTASGAESPAINGSGRISFLTVLEGDLIAPQTSNTQASVICLLSRDERVCQGFAREFSRFGVVK